jgi:outer membrane protein OmpA-like peptidoglycan-associated protein
MHIFKWPREAALRRCDTVARAFALFALFLNACTHTLVLESFPTDSPVYLLDKRGGKAKLLGRTPLSTDEIAALRGSGVVVESPGHVPLTVVVPFQNSALSKISVKLTPFDEKFLRSLPFELHRKVVDELAGELIELQQTLYGGSKDEAEMAIRDAEKRLGRTSRFHQIVGSYRFYNGMMEEAVRSFSKSLELDSTNETARRMLVLADVKVANSSQAARNKAYSDLNAAAMEVAQLGHGYLVRTKSNPDQKDYDGLDIIIPTDVLFKPYSGRLRGEGVSLLKMLAVELQKNEHPRNILVEGHTGNDMYAELRNMPAQTTGSVKLQGLWEISSERAGAVATFLKSEGVSAARWSIAGYGDSRPLVLPDHLKKNPGKIDLEALSRRVVIKVALMKTSPTADVIDANDAKKMQERLNNILPDPNVPPANEAASSDKTGRNPSGNAEKNGSEGPEGRSVSGGEALNEEVEPQGENQAATRSRGRVDNEEQDEQGEIPRTLPKNTVLQNRAREAETGVSLRARRLNSNKEVETEAEEVSESVPMEPTRAEQKKARVKKTREMLKDAEKRPPLPAIPLIRPQE